MKYKLTKFSAISSSIKRMVASIITVVAIVVTLSWNTQETYAAEPFLGEIRIFAFNFAPQGWTFCDGQILPINQHQSLYSLLGTTYGGNETVFALPDLRGRVIVGAGTGSGLSSRNLGQKSGNENSTLTEPNMPSHSHTATTTIQEVMTHGQDGRGGTDDPTFASWAVNRREDNYNLTAPNVDMIDGSIQIDTFTAVSGGGGGQPFNNMMPFLALHPSIALNGLFPD